MNKNILGHNIIISLLIIFYFVFGMLHPYLKFMDQFYFSFAKVFVSILVLIWLISNNKINKINFKLFFFMIFAFICSFCIFYNKNRSFTSLLTYLNIIPVILTLFKIKLNKIIIKIFCLVCLFIFFLLSLYNNLTQVNAITLHLLLILSLYIISINKSDTVKPLDLNILIVMMFGSLFVGIICGGRSGILSLCVLLLGLIFYVIRKNKNNKLFLYVNIFLLLLLSLTVSIVFYNYIFNRMLNKLEYNKGREEPRLLFWLDFYNVATSNSLNLLFGPSLIDVESIAVRNCNPHSAFVYAYANFGLVFFLYIIYRIIISIWILIKIRPLWGLVLLAMTIRSLTDTTAFIGFYDPIIIFMITALPYKYNSKQNIKIVYRVGE